MQPVFGGIDYIQRYEFQHRGAIHCHMVMSCSNGPTCDELDLAIGDFPKLNDDMTDEQKKEAQDKIEQILESKRKLVDFASLQAGISAVHPELDPIKWPRPFGQNAAKPKTNVLRQNFTDIAHDKEALYDMYINLVNRVLLHYCRFNSCQDVNRSITKKITDDKGVVRKIREWPCRFHFPEAIFGFKTTELDGGGLHTVKLDPGNDKDEVTNPTVKGAAYVGQDLKHLRNHPCIVCHIPELAILHGANIENKEIKSFAQLHRYLMKYVMKAEKASDLFSNIAKTIAQLLDDNATLKGAVQKILLKSIGERDMSLNECALICQNLPYVIYSKTARTASLKGSKKVKMDVASDAEELTEDDFAQSYWKRDTHKGFNKLCEDYPDPFKYDKHPRDISLREFMNNFSKNWKYTPSVNVFPHFLPTYRYVVNKSKPNYEEFCRCILLMDKPGAYLDNVGNGFESCSEELKDFVENSPFCPQLVKDEFKESQIDVKEPEADNDKDPESKDGKTVKPKKVVQGNALDELYIDKPDNVPNAPREDWMEMFAHDNDVEEPFPIPNQEVEAPDLENLENPDEYRWTSDSDELDLNPGSLKEVTKWLEHQKKVHQIATDESIEYDPSLLNDKQKIAYDYMTKWVLEKVSNPEDTPPVFLNISGSAGSGKSFFLNCLSQFIRLHAGKSFLKMAAPTASAGFLVKAQTLHSLLKLEITRSTRREITPLSGEVLKNIQEEFKDVQLLIIDEKSMIGCYMLYCIHSRLKEIKGKPKGDNLDSFAFGGVSVVLLGDMSQLCPVADLPMFTTEAKKISHYQVMGRTLFQLFTKTIIFDVIMRQKGDDQKDFRQCLKNLASGEFTKEDWEFLKKRDLYGGNFSLEQQEDFLNTAIMICARRADMTTHNIRRIKALGTPIATIVSENNCSDAASADATKAQGLLSQIMLAKNCQVILTSNLWKETGLTNGARGIVKYILYAKGKKPTQLPEAVIVQFEQYIGPNFFGLPQCVPIVPVTRTWYMNKNTCIRVMLPLEPAYAMTIHKSQGKTMDKVIINISQKEFANGLAYTAVSRARKIEHLVFFPFPNFRRFTSIFTAKLFKDRKEQDQKEKVSDQKFMDANA